MHHIEPHALWLGHAGDGRDFRKVMDTGIEALVHLAMEEPVPQVPRSLLFVRVPLVDGSGNREGLITLAVTTLAQLLRARIPTLVCCGAGRSRTPAVSAAGLALATRQSPEECLRFIVEQYHCDVSPGLWQDVQQVMLTATPLT
jgi:protein-tyrosine phosphatase